MTGIDKVTPEVVSDWAAGTLECWLEGYTDPDEDINDQCKMTWETPMEVSPKASNVYIGEVLVVPVTNVGPAPPSDGKRFRIAIKVVDA